MITILFLVAIIIGYLSGGWVGALIGFGVVAASIIVFMLALYFGLLKLFGGSHDGN